MIPTTRYARSGDSSIAYQVAGEGPLDVLFLPGWISQIEHLWEFPAVRRFLERLAQFSRLILFDRRGTGLSDRLVGHHSLDQDMQDALAVLDAAGSERAALFAYGVGGAVAARLAADHPRRVGALIMYAAIARASWAPDYEWALRAEERHELTEQSVAGWGELGHPALAQLAPSMADDPALAGWFSRMQRLAASPIEARQMFTAIPDIDVRESLPNVSVPTLVMHRSQDTAWDVRHSRYIAENVPGARYVELDGTDSFPFVGDADAIIEEIEQFLTGGRGGGELARALMTVMFTDIVQATALAAQVGDRRWRDMLAQHDQLVRVELGRFGGRRSRRSATGSSPCSTGLPRAACAAHWRSPSWRRIWGSRCASACTRASAS